MTILLQPMEPWPWSRLPWPVPVVAYIRPARDSLAKSQRSQDALALWHEGKTYVLVVCDGVSQSFFGDFAAWVLAEALLHYLRDLPAHRLPEAEALLAWGQALARDVQERYAALRLPEGLPEMVRQVLEEKRRLGSETMFAGLRVDLPGPELPQGRLLLIHGGNIRSRIWGSQGRVHQASMNEAVRWSTTRGFTGSPYLWHAALQDETGAWLWQGAVLYTDGLASLDEVTLPWPLEQAQALAEQDWRSPWSDDQGYVEIRWAQPQWAKVLTWPDEDPPVPRSPRVLEDGVLTWEREGRGSYTQVHWQAEDREALWSTPETRIPVPTWASKARIRHVNALGRPSPWSAWTHLIPPRAGAQAWREAVLLALVALLLLAYFAALLWKAYAFAA